MNKYNLNMRNNKLLIAFGITVTSVLTLCCSCCMFSWSYPSSTSSLNKAEKNISDVAGINQIPIDSTDEKTYKVLDVVDGDTIKIDYEGNKETVRLIGVDTPESVDPNKDVQCFAIEASNKTKELVSNKNVIIEFDNSQGERDKYGRLLLYVYIPDTGEMLNENLIKEGYAFEYTYNKAYKYQKDFKSAEEFARENSKGLWNINTCNGNPEANKTTPTPTPKPTFTPLPTPTIKTQTPKQPAPPPPQTVNPPAACKYSCSGPDKDCKDFSTQAEAQTFFNCCGFSATNDPMRLDKANGVGNGIACESLP